MLTTAPSLTLARPLTAHERMVNTARAAGMPSDQLRAFLKAGYVPQPMQMRFHAVARLADRADGPTQIGVGGARGPGKSHAVFAQVTLDDCRRQDGLKVLYLRKVGKNAREQFEDLRQAVLKYTPHDYNRSSGIVTIGNNSRVFIGHFNKESDIDGYLGLEYDAIVPEEATTLSQSKYRALRDSNRTSKRGWRPRIYTTTNPGGVGHVWYRKAFIDPWRAGTETDTRFIFGTIDDNRFVDPDYKRKLEENTGWKLRAYRYGDWDIAAGQFFVNWDYERHTTATAEVQYDWRVWLAMDYGFAHWNVVYLLTQTGDGQIIIVDEYAARGQLIAHHAQAVRAMLERNRIHPSRVETFVAGGDVFARTDSGQTVADKWRAEGFELAPANTDRIDGAAEILDRLGTNRLRFSRRCVRLIECLPALTHDPNRPEDVLKVDTDDDGNGGDDPYDAARYGVMVAARAPQTNYAASYRR